MRVDRYKIEALASELEQYKADQDLFWDTLDGETDVLDYVGHNVRVMLDADAQIAGAKEIIATYQARIKAAEARKDKVKEVLKVICDITGEEKIPHPLATISMRKGSTSVEITDLDQIPTQLCKITKSPDKVAIKSLLEAGEQIDGAELKTNPKTVSVRIK